MTESSEIMHGIRFMGNQKVMANVWAPFQKAMRIKNMRSGETRDMKPLQKGYFSSEMHGNAGDRYVLVLADGTEIPDPASRFQPEGIDKPSMMIDTGSFNWKCRNWDTFGMKESIIQEIHVGAYTESGTYSELEHHVDHILETGINTIELMPLAQAYGSRNWGYDGVFPFAPSFSYGSPEDLQHFVDYCHQKGLNVILDVVYNHLGPLGNVFPKLGPYFGSTYHNPWGDAINFDGSGSDEVRSFVLQNVQYWIEEYRMDGLRLDAVHSIYDGSNRHILAEISDLVHSMEKKLERNIRIIAESDRNDPSTVKEREKCGYGFSGQWNDDFHHALYCFLSGERSGYYMDYGDFHKIVHAYRNGFVYDGVYSNFLQKTRGSALEGIPMDRLVVFTQNHDQVGNRAFGERPITILGEKNALIFAVAVLASPFTPMMFMGEEFGSSSPFLFFTDSPDKEFARKIFQGRKEEFRSFNWTGDLPDPGSIETFIASKVDHARSEEGTGKKFLKYYKNLISIRKRYIQGLKPEVWSHDEKQIITLDYRETGTKVIMSLSSVENQLQIKTGGVMIFDSEDEDVMEPGSVRIMEGTTLIMPPYSAVIVRYH